MQAWCNERGYKIITSKGESVFIYDLPNNAIDHALRLYICRWMVLNHMMEIINELKETIEDRDLVLYSDGRIIEELKGELVPNHTYALASLHYFIEYDYPKFRRVTIEKCAPTTVSDKLNAAQSDTARSG